MKRSYKIAAAALILMVLWLLSGLLFPSEDDTKDEASQTAAVTAQDVVLKIEMLKSQPYRRHVIINGATEPNRRVELKAETQGAVKTIAAQEGSPLKKGTVIVEIDERDRRIRLTQAKALLAQRQIEYNANRELEEEGFQTPIRLAQSLTQLEEAKVNLRQIELDLGYTKLRAPFDGILEKVNVEVGDFVGVGVFGGEGALATVVDNDPLLIAGQVAERDRKDIQLGGTASGRVVEGKLPLNGTITYLSSVAEAESRTFRVEISVANPDGIVPAGVTAELQLPGKPVDAYRVSSSVLALDDSGKVGVKLVDEQNIVRFHSVEIVEDSKDGMWIGGLPSEIRLITLGQNTVANGQQLTPEKVSQSITQPAATTPAEAPQP